MKENGCFFTLTKCYRVTVSIAYGNLWKRQLIIVSPIRRFDDQWAANRLRRLPDEFMTNCAARLDTKLDRSGTSWVAWVKPYKLRSRCDFRSCLHV